MKPISSVIIFLLLVCSAVWAGFDSYHCAETAIVQDMNQALSKTLAGKREAWITPDTIQSYRQYLQIADLRRRSFVSYALGEDSHSLCSRQMSGRQVAIRFYSKVMLFVPSLRCGDCQISVYPCFPIVSLGLDGYIYCVFSSSSHRQIGAG